MLAVMVVLAFVFGVGWSSAATRPSTKLPQMLAQRRLDRRLSDRVGRAPMRTPRENDGLVKVQHERPLPAARSPARQHDARIARSASGSISRA